MMKKMAALILGLLMLAAAASAETVATAVASPVDPNHLVCVTVNARITGYDEAKNELILELIVPETYDREEILRLKAGDAIYTQGREVRIETVTERDGYLIFNEGEYEFSEGSVWLYERADGNFAISEYEDNTWTVIGEIQAPVTDRLLFLDEIEPSSGDILPLPTVHSAAEFLAILAPNDEDYDPGFATDNVYVVFDAEGQLALIVRYYVPWQ